MSLFATFQSLPLAASTAHFSAVRLSSCRGDFLAKGGDGEPVFLLRDSSLISYYPSIQLKHVSVQFHSTCRVTAIEGVIEDQFAVISCSADIYELHEVFIRCLAAAVEQLPINSGTPEIQHCLLSILDLFRALGRPSKREVAGLWAELFVIARSKNILKALTCWHADQFERFDFSWSLGCLEVKAATRGLRQHDFAIEQLKPPLGGKGYVASVLLQPLNGGEGVIDLANEIEANVTGQPQLRQKLWESIFSVLGSDFSEHLDCRFDTSYAERSLTVFAMGDIPAPHDPSDSRVSAVRFRADLSTVNSSLAGSGSVVLNYIFG